MHTIDHSVSVRKWVAHGKNWMPASVNVHCPYCARDVNFRADEVTYDAPRNTISFSGRCPNCNKKTIFWAISPARADKSKSGSCKCLAMYPEPRSPRAPFEWDFVLPDDKLVRAYRETIDVFNAGVWTATVTSCRRLLEGIASSMVKEVTDRESLAQQLRRLGQEVDLGEPINELAAAVREGGNIGAHFDDKEPDRELAEAMLELMEHLIVYLFALPALVANFEDRIGQLGEQPEAD